MAAYDPSFEQNPMLLLTVSNLYYSAVSGTQWKWFHDKTDYNPLKTLWISQIA